MFIIIYYILVHASITIRYCVGNVRIDFSFLCRVILYKFLFNYKYVNIIIYKV